MIINRNVTKEMLQSFIAVLVVLLSILKARCFTRYPAWGAGGGVSSANNGIGLAKSWFEQAAILVSKGVWWLPAIFIIYIILPFQLKHHRLPWFFTRHQARV